MLIAAFGCFAVIIAALALAPRPKAPVAVRLTRTAGRT